MLPLGCLPLWGIEGVTLIFFKNNKIEIYGKSLFGINLKSGERFPYLGL